MALQKGQHWSSPQRGGPMTDTKNSFTTQTITADTPTLYYYSSGTLTTDAGEVAGTVVIFPPKKS